MYSCQNDGLEEESWLRGKGERERGKEEILLCKQGTAQSIFGCKWPALALIVKENRSMSQCMALTPQFNRAGCIPGYATIIHRKPYGYFLKTKGMDRPGKKRIFYFTMFFFFFFYPSGELSGSPRKFCSCVHILRHMPMAYQDSIFMKVLQFSFQGTITSHLMIWNKIQMITKQMFNGQATLSYLLVEKESQG